VKLPRRQFLHLAAGAAASSAVSPFAWGQSNNEVASSKKGTRVITLGTKNGPFPEAGRAQSSNLLVVNGSQYIIDASDGVTRRLARLRTNFRDIDNIFITHPHSDHTGGLGALMTAIYDTNRTNLVNIYGPPGTAASVQGLLQFLAVSSEIRIRSQPSRIATFISLLGARAMENTSHTPTDLTRLIGQSSLRVILVLATMLLNLPKGPICWSPS
jgi:hypothetical protein